MTLNSKRLIGKFTGTAAELKAQCDEVLGTQITVKCQYYDND